MTLDDILQAILTDLRNNCDGIDLSKGSVDFANAVALASVSWGMYKNINYNKKQIFPETSDSVSLEEHAYGYGLSRAAGETDAELLMRLQTRRRQAPAGGNEADYVTWAKQVTGIASAKCIPVPQGPGTVDVVILANEETTGSETPTTELIAAVYAHIDEVRPVTAGTFRVLAAQIIETDLTMSLSGSVTAATVAAEITSLMAALGIGQTLYRAALINLAIAAGATDATISAPASNIVPTNYQVIRPGTITVS